MTEKWIVRCSEHDKTEEAKTFDEIWNKYIAHLWKFHAPIPVDSAPNVRVGIQLGVIYDAEVEKSLEETQPNKKVEP